MRRTLSEEHKKKIAESRAKFIGKKAPRYGQKWSQEQRIKHQLTAYHNREREKQLKMFLILYNQEWEKFQQQQKTKEY